MAANLSGSKSLCYHVNEKPLHDLALAPQDLGNITTRLGNSRSNRLVGAFVKFY